jgi:hypothetical protein
MLVTRKKFYSAIIQCKEEKVFYFLLLEFTGKEKNIRKRKKIGLAYQSSCCSRIIAEKKIKTLRILIENTNGCA